MREVIHHCLAVALLAAFTQGPFVHAHDGATSHVHWHDLLHLRSWASSTQELSLAAPDHGSGARFEDWVFSKSEDRAPWAAGRGSSVPHASLECRAMPGNRNAPPAHEPPWRLNLSSRAPPV